MAATANPMSLNGTPNVYSTLTFNRGTNPRNPGPGECVWMDRPVKATEPNRMFYSAVGQQSFILYQKSSIPFAGALKYLLAGVMSDNFFYVRVYRKDDVFQVTKLGP